MKIYKRVIWGKPSNECYDVEISNSKAIIRFVKIEDNRIIIFFAKDSKLFILNNNKNYKIIEEKLKFINTIKFDISNKAILDDVTKSLYFEIIKSKFHESS